MEWEKFPGRCRLLTAEGKKGRRNPQTSLVLTVIYAIKIKSDGLNWNFLLPLGGSIGVFILQLDANSAIHHSRAMLGQWWALEVDKKQIPDEVLNGGRGNIECWKRKHRLLEEEILNAGRENIEFWERKY